MRQDLTVSSLLDPSGIVNVAELCLFNKFFALIRLSTQEQNNTLSFSCDISNCHCQEIPQHHPFQEHSLPIDRVGRGIVQPHFYP